MKKIFPNKFAIVLVTILILAMITQLPPQNAPMLRSLPQAVGLDTALWHTGTLPTQRMITQRF